MALLYCFHFYGTNSECDLAVEWCDQQWPYTRGATWTLGLRCQTISLRGSKYQQTFFFQRQEDVMLFSLIWG